MALQIWLPLDVGLNISNDYDTTIYRESDGSMWLRIFHHNNPTNNGLFASTDDFTKPIYKDANRWSNLQLLNQMNSWELMVKQKATSSSTEMKYRWKQDVNPYSATYSQVTANTVIKINVPSDATSAIGGMYHIGSSTYFCITNGSNGNWFGAIGAWTNYNGGFPGYPNTSVTTGYLDLYMRIDEKYFRNLGTSGLSFNTTNNAKYNFGKVTTNSIENTSNTVGGFISNAQINLNYTQSMFCWVYFNSFYSASNLMGILGQHRYASNQGMGLTVKYVSSTSGYLSINTGNGSSRTYNTYCGNTLLTSGKWYHVGYTYDGINVNLYVNGILDGTFTIADMKIVSDYIVLFAWSLDGTSGATIQGNYKLDGRLNDVRLYDHCLSIKEIKNLAKGLMLHYSLSRSGANLLVNSNFNNGTTNWTADTGTMNVLNDSNFGNILTFKASGSNNRIYESVSGLFVSGNTYTYSFYAKSNSSVIVKPSRAIVDFGYSHTITTVWQYYSGTILATDNSNAFSLQLNNTTSTVSFANIKLEIGDKATPWIPNSADTLYTTMRFNTNIEDDISGYNNNGTRVNITTWNTDTPRYLSGMVFNGSNSYIYLPKNSARPKDAITISIWAWMSDWSTYNGRLISCTEGGGWNFEPSSDKIAFSIGTGSSSNTYKTVLSTTTLSQLGNKWHHFVGTYDGLLVKIYIDGILENTTTAYSNVTPIYYANNYTFVGAEAGGDSTTPASNYFNGRLSDVRIYSNALSADEIKELYQTSASIDNNYNIHCYDLVESL